MSRRLLAVYAGISLAVLVALAGCGAGGDGDGVATAGGAASPSPTASGGAAGDQQERAFKYAQCMRDHGVDMPDPVVENGQVRIQVRAKPGTDVDAAQAACKDYAPDGGPGGGSVDPRMQEQMLAFARCMREHGVESFPDPDPNRGGVRIDGRIAGDPEFEAAQRACEPEMGKPGPRESQ